MVTGVRERGLVKVGRAGLILSLQA
jgi:hypothetical protein